MSALISNAVAYAITDAGNAWMTNGQIDPRLVLGSSPG
jgi:hypothetical protein